jgi:hypothetical protein
MSEITTQSVEITTQSVEITKQSIEITNQSAEIIQSTGVDSIIDDPVLTQIYQLVHKYNASQLDKFNFPMRLIVEHHNYICCCRNCQIEASEVDEYRALNPNESSIK